MSGANDAPMNHQTSSPVGGNGDEASRNELVNAFNKIDVNSDGSITKEELWGHMSKQGKGLGISKKDVDDLFERIDEDGNGVIDLTEYSIFMEEVKGRCGNGWKKKRRSSLKCATLKESLLSCDQPKEEPKKAPRDSSRRGLLVKSRSSRFGRSASMTDVCYEKEDGDAPAASGPLLRRSASMQARSASIRFFDVEVREYVVTASDNPCCRSGVALELGWDYDVRERLHLDTFEDKRSEERAKDFRKEKKLTRLEREKILRELGATTKEIQQATKRATIIRNQRRKSVATATAKQDKAREKAENRLRKFKSLFRRSSKEIPTDVQQSNRTLMLLMGLDGTAENVSHQ